KARMMIVNDLNSQGFIFKKEKIENNLGKCYRCGCIVEPIISTQWFVKMDKLAKPAIEIVKKKQISFIPERFSKIYMHWMNKIKDWCISRQLWWGHRIPAWYCKNCDYITVEIEPSKCEKCNSKDIKQDEDSLDTWFSSALWPFSSLGWPEKTEIFLKFYPTDVLVTGYDIIFFWVARMIFSALELTGTRPFKKVLIHGLVRDSEGKKMSKSLGNGIDPLEIISKYGADALRLALITGLTPGNDTRFCEKKIEGARNFINKIWNAARFIQINLGEKIKINEIDIKNLPIHHAWMLSRINEVTKHVHKNIENFEFGICLHNIYNMFWDEFCDWYIEFCKIDIKRDTSFNILCYVFFRILKLLHPFIPFVTEKIWSIFNSCPLIISEYPKYDTSFGNHLAEESMNKLISCIRTIRSKRNEMNTPCTKKIKIFIITEDNELFSNNCDKIKSLVCASEVIINTDPDSKKEFLTSFSECAKILISVDDLIDRNELKNRIEKELKILNNSRIKSQNLIKNQNFISNAPKDIVQKIKNRIDDDTRKIEKLKLEILKYSSF
ncbi:MAG: class I tRNA ligase family protein, partial [Firmicutes bacterium]|nr:class I tRNA ligase family protein [Bacillota bacterium]